MFCGKNGLEVFRASSLVRVAGRKRMELCD